MTICVLCGDQYPEEQAHECWAALKIATQETLPEPQKTDPPAERVARVVWPSR
jgi:hypothetical protein